MAAAITTGLMAGVFGLYANAIMPGLRRTSDRTFVEAFQSIDRTIINPLFLATFFAPLACMGLAAVLHLGDGGRPILPWIIAAFVLYLIGFVITLVVNVPLNDGIKSAGAPESMTSLGAVRERFDESKWIRWNLVRTVLTTTAFICLAWALVQYGRTLSLGTS